MILISYNISVGIAIKNCEKTSSPGVNIADKIKTHNIAYLRFVINHFGVTIPNFVRNKITSGNWKIIPNDSKKIVTKEIYELTEING